MIIPLGLFKLAVTKFLHFKRRKPQFCSIIIAKRFPECIQNEHNDRSRIYQLCSNKYRGEIKNSIGWNLLETLLIFPRDINENLITQLFFRLEYSMVIWE